MALPRHRNIFDISPMALQDSLWKIDSEILDLTSNERIVLGVLISFINAQGIKKNGYEAYPSTELLCSRTGLSFRTVEKARKALRDKDWIIIKPGNGRGNANHYFINGKKIIEAYNESNPKSTRGLGKMISWERICHNQSVLDAIKKSMKPRNTYGLLRGGKLPINIDRTILVHSQ